MPRRKAATTSSTDYPDSGLQTSCDSVSGREDGLFLVGEIADRVKKMVTAQGMEVEVVTYTVVCDAMRRYFVDDFDPDRYFSRW